VGAPLGRRGLSAGEIVFAALKPSSAILLLLAAGLLTLFFSQRLATWLFAVGAFAFLVTGLLPVGAWALRALEARFPPADLSRPPDGIIVLGGYLDGARVNDGRYLALDEAGERLTSAAELAVRFPDARLVIAGNPIGPADQSSAELSADLLETFGIARERMVLEDRSHSTWENAIHTLESAKPLSDETYLLLTSAFHIPRAMATFRTAGWPALLPWPVDHRVPEGNLWGTIPLDPLDGLRLADRAAREWTALLVYRVTGRIDGVFPAPVPVAEDTPVVPDTTLGREFAD